jgi:hypothetical protein
VNDERRRSVEVALQRMVNQHPHVTLPEMIAWGIENALDWPQMETPPPDHLPRMPLRGRWGCGCAMEACEIRWGSKPVTGPDGSGRHIEVVCLTHDLRGVSDDKYVEGPITEGYLQNQAVSQLNRAHEEQCR